MQCWALGAPLAVPVGCGAGRPQQWASGGWVNTAGSWLWAHMGWLRVRT